MEGIAGFFMICDALIVMWALHKIYRSMFPVTIYFSLQSWFYEKVIIFVIAGMIVMGPVYLLGYKNSFTFIHGLYFVALFIASIFVIVRFSKAKEAVDGDSDKSEE
jgi:Ca2+/Na+ antiporter